MRSTSISVAILIMIAALCVVGISLGSQQQVPKNTPVKAIHTTVPSLSQAQLTAQLATDTPAIHAALFAALPTVQSFYTLGHEQLLGDGTWYGAVLTYKGTDEANRDSLRIVLQKKAGQWTLRTPTPSIIISKYDIPDAPEWILDAINQPSYLPGTADSPAITPGQ